MSESLRELLSPERFMPHGHCYLWEPGLVWLQVLSNTFIGASYVAIAATLAYMVRRGRYLPFKGMALAFGLFIITCGLTHFYDVVVIWKPMYWMDGGLRAVTAIASVGTAILLPSLVPEAIGLARGARLARERGIELEAAVEDLSETYAKAKELDLLKTQFFANVSHELRTPLTLILGPAEKLLSAGNLTDEQRRDVEVLLRNGRTLLRHVGDLLDVARIEAGRLSVEYARVDLARLVRLSAAHFDALAQGQGRPWTVDAPSELAAEVDPEKLRRVLLNLLGNAFKFTPAPGGVRCRLRELSGRRALIEVEDEGPGIPAAERRRVFERFQQVDGGSTRSFGGTGLGLSISKEYVELHAGRICVEEAPDGGALFRVELPLDAPAGSEVAADPDDEGGAPEQAARQVLAELEHRVEDLARASGAEAPLVLVVEDNAEMNRFLCERPLRARAARAARARPRAGDAPHGEGRRRAARGAARRRSAGLLDEALRRGRAARPRREPRHDEARARRPAAGARQPARGPRAARARGDAQAARAPARPGRDARRPRARGAREPAQVELRQHGQPRAAHAALLADAADRAPARRGRVAAPRFARARRPHAAVDRPPARHDREPVAVRAHPERPPLDRDRADRPPRARARDPRGPAAPRAGQGAGARAAGAAGAAAALERRARRAPAPGEPDRQRDQVHRRRAGRGRPRALQRAPPDLGERHRSGHRARRPRAHLRALRAARGDAQEARPGRRTGPGARARDDDLNAVDRASSLVLIVEDDPDTRRNLAFFIRREDREVHTAANGREALALLREIGRPCLILLDLMMPVMDGWELRAALLEDTELGRVPVVLLSGVADIQREAASLGALGYLTKPIDLGRLVQLVESHCGRRMQS